MGTKLSIAAGGGVFVAGVLALLLLGIGTVSAVLAVVALALGAAGLAWWLHRESMRPISSLVRALDSTSLSDDILSAAAPPADSRGDLVYAVSRFRKALAASLVERRTARERAELLESYEAEFLRSLSHELRTPLNSILGFTQVLLDEIDGPLTPDQREDIQTIRDSGAHLKELVDDVLDLAAMQSGRFELEVRRIDVRPIVREVARILEGQRRQKPIEIEVEISDEPLEVEVDPKRLRQILMNLGTNAMKFTDKGSVRIFASREADRVRLSVRDTGLGISRSDVAAIFEEFKQVGDVRRKSQGSGLGLAIVKQLVAVQRGSIDVESVVGVGSIFHVDFPFAERA
jgi:signal transduction histidine kinase